VHNSEDDSFELIRHYGSSFYEGAE
jgi:hypothetical protein